MRHTGVTARGIITPIFKQGDDLASQVCSSICDAAREEGFELHDRDVVAVTEAVVARTQGNYATCEQIAEDVRAKLGGEDMGIVFPILSRNRFAILLRAIAMSCKKLYVQLSYPADEVGNAFLTWDDIDERGVDPMRDSFDEKSFVERFGSVGKHRFTGVDYVQYYKSLGDNILERPEIYPQLYEERPLLRYTHTSAYKAHNKGCRRRARLRNGRYSDLQRQRQRI